MHPDNEAAGTRGISRSPRPRGRGRHFRPSRRKPRPAAPAPGGAAVEEAAVEPDRATASSIEPGPEPLEAAAQAPRKLEKREPIPDAPSISQAIEHVQQVIDDMKGALEQMELALELLEEAERQKIDDDREIKALQKALERVNRFRGPSRSPE